jgi:hypothetical protein
VFPTYPAEAGLDLTEATAAITIYGGVVRAASARAAYDHINFKPPGGARREAKAGLAWRREHGRGGTAVGIARARDIARGVNLSPSTVRRMKAFFDRHQGNKKAEGWSPGEAGYPSNGRIAWALWGGDPGYTWAKKVVGQMEAAEASAADAAFAAEAKKACAKCGGKVEGKGNKYACGTCKVDDAEVVDAGSEPDPTLYYLQSVVVSTGFNRNGHFFPAADLWAARATVANKPFNLEHVKDDIIGHSLRAWAVGADLTPLADGEPPAAFHVMDESVIYRYRPTKRGQALASTLDAIERGEYWVSMECLFAEFDYAVGHSPTGEFLDIANPTIIRRTAETAHLTQYLRTVKRADGTRGPGVLPDGRMIGQALRQMTFVGKGLVKVPANPASAVYTLNGRLLSGLSASATTIFEQPVYTPAGATGHTPKELEMTPEQLQAELVATKAALEAAAKSREAAEIEHANAMAALKAELEKVTVALAEANKALADELTAKRAAARLEQVKASFKLEDADAAELVAKLEPLSDEAFAAHISTVNKLTQKTALPALASVIPDAPPAPTPVPPPAPQGDAKAGALGLLKTIQGKK